MTLSTLLNGVPSLASHTMRYSNRAVLKRENVAEHTFHTMFYAWVIALDMQSQWEAKLNIEILLVRCLVHDLEECITGDVIRDLKHADPEITRLIEIQGLKAIQSMEKSLGMESGKLELPWSDAKVDDLEGQVVRVADCLSVVSYLIGEYTLGNRSLLDIHRNVISYIESVRSKVRNEYLRGLCNEVLAYFKEAVDYK